MTHSAIQGPEANEAPMCRECGEPRPRRRTLGRCLLCFKRELRKRHRMIDRRCLNCKGLFVTQKPTELFCSQACRMRGAR